MINLARCALALCIAVSMTACGNDDKQQQSGSSSSTPTAESPPPSTPKPSGGNSTGAGSAGGTSTGSGGSSDASGSGVDASVPSIPGPTAPTTPVTSSGSFDAYYAQSFRLKPLSADAIPSASAPERAKSFSEAFIDPVYGTRLYHATSGKEGQGDRMRHEYSRRQAFNANNSRFLAQDAKGYWYLYDAKSFSKLRVLKDLAGDCEPIWHPSDPNKLYATSRDGGLQWWLLDVEKGSRELVFDFTGKTSWPNARSFWTKGEGTTSADGRYLGLMATSYDSQSKKVSIYGLVTLDLKDKKIVGTLDASKFDGKMPDYVSTSPSGRYVITSWDGGGTFAYTRDFSSRKTLHGKSEHSDLAFGPNREDYYVYSDYDTGAIVAREIDTLKSFDVAPIYQGDHESYVVHISGQAFDKPGWVVISTYGDSSKYGAVSPAPSIRPEYRKVWLAELKPKGRKFNVAHIRQTPIIEKTYFAEPQASVSRDLSRIIFSSDFGSGGTPDDYIIGLPSWFDKP